MLKAIVYYFISLLFFLSFIVSCFENFGASLGFLIVSLMVFPPLKIKLDKYLRPLLKDKTDKQYGIIKFWIGFIILIVFSMIFPTSTPVHDNKPTIVKQNQSTGFNIDDARGYLLSKGFILECNEYGCATYKPYLTDENGSNITYNIEKNNNNIADKIYLHAFIHKKTGRAEMNTALIELAKTLTQNATGFQLPVEVITALENYTTGLWDIKNYTLEIKQEKWVTGLGESVYFIIFKK